MKALLEQASQQQTSQEATHHDTSEPVTLQPGTTLRSWMNRVNKFNRQDWEVFIAKPPEDGGPTTAVIEEYLADDIAGGPSQRSALRPRRPLPSLIGTCATRNSSTSSSIP